MGPARPVLHTALMLGLLVALPGCQGVEPLRGGDIDADMDLDVDVDVDVDADTDGCQYGACLGESDCLAGWDCKAGCCEPSCEEAPKLSCDADDDCDLGSYCELGCCRPAPPACITDEDCEACCGPGYCCVLGQCQPCQNPYCITDEDCPSDQACIGGICKERSGCPYSVRIITPPSIVCAGESIQFLAQMLNANGAVVAGMEAPAWASSDEKVATIDTATGLATCGDAGGATDITAAVCGCTSDPVTLTCYPAVSDTETRMIVTDRETGAPIAGALVVADGVEGWTDEHGVASFAAVKATAVDVFTPGYAYLTIPEGAAWDMLIPLRPLPDPTQAAGVRGEFDFSQLIATGEVEMAFAGLSFPRELSAFTLADLFGEYRRTRIVFGQLYDDDAPVPAGLHLALGTTVFKEGYAPLGRPGPRVLWGLGGQVPLAELMNIAGPIIDRCSDVCDPTLEIARSLPQIVPYLYRFQHGVITGVDVPAIPRRVDDIDENMNGRTDDLVPDYDSMTVAGPLLLDTPQRHALALEIPPLPHLQGARAEGALVLLGAQAPEGFVPLGIGAGMDRRDENDVADGLVGEDSDGLLSLKLAPPHSGIEGNPYRVLTLALHPNQRYMLDLFHMPLSGRIQTLQRLPDDGRLAVPAFLGWVESAGYNVVSRGCGGEEVSGADLYRITLSGGGVEWEVLRPRGDPDFTLPRAPDGFTELGTDPTVRIEAWAMQDGLGLDELLEFNATNLDRLPELQEAFSTLLIGAEPGGGCELNCECSGGPRGGTGAMIAVVVLAMLALRRRRG